MGNSFDTSGDNRIEISGWGLDNSFFAERTDSLWTPDGEKYVQLHCALPEGAMVFIRLLASESSREFVPVAYQVQGVGPMDGNGRYRMKLKQFHPRSKESLLGKSASNQSEDSGRVSDTREAGMELQHEEILQ